MKKTIGAVCALLIFSCLLSACGGKELTEPDTAQTESLQTTPDPTATTEPGPDPDLGVVRTLELNWKRGYVASSTNVNATSVIMENAQLYSYTDLFTIPRAGTKITFRDTVESGSGGAGYASDNAYVFSVWQENGDGTWSLDGGAMQFPGVGFADSTISAITDRDRKILTYTYVTARDRETLRICYHSGERTGDRMTYPAVTAEYTGGVSSEALYREEFRDVFDWIESTKSAAYYPILEGKTINFIGDSYFAGNGQNKIYGWPSLLATKYGITHVNHGINGSTVCVTTDNKYPMVKRYGKLPANDPDIVIVEGGRNDRSQNKSGKGAEIGSNNTTDESTFKGALTAIIRGLREKYPNALILCVTPWCVDDGTTEYGTAMKEVCAFEGVPCFDATNQALCGVYMTSADFRKTYCMAENDVSHLNPEGMKLVMPAFEKFIAEKYTAFCGG